MNTAKAYFKNASNLKVIKNTEVENVRINGKTKEAVGVYIRH